MPSIESDLYDLGRIDQLAAQDTPVHRVDPRAKVVATMVFLVTVASFGRYDVLPLTPFLVFPVVMASLGNLPIGYLARRVLIAAPFALLVGAFNPLLDHTAMTVGGIALTGGWVSFASIVVRFLLTTAAALVLVGSTGLTNLCAALSRLGVPDVFTSQLLFLYRYTFVLATEALTMRRAYALRALGGKALPMRVYAQLLGHLLLRTYGRARRIHTAMLCRGFDGRVRMLREPKFRASDWGFTLGWSAAFAIFRSYDVPALVGRVVTGLLS